jgi:hypothetical protein
VGRSKQSLSEVLHRQNKFGLRRKTGAAKRPKFISSLDFLSPFCVKTKERYKPIKLLEIARKRFEHPSIASSTKGANRKFSGQSRAVCSPRKALGWLSWGTFFASFLWASKEMKRKNIPYLVK